MEREKKWKTYREIESEREKIKLQEFNLQRKGNFILLGKQCTLASLKRKTTYKESV